MGEEKDRARIGGRESVFFNGISVFTKGYHIRYDVCVGFYRRLMSAWLGWVVLVIMVSLII
jgi:hypothetical protein